MHWGFLDGWLLLSGFVAIPGGLFLGLFLGAIPGAMPQGAFYGRQGQRS